MLYSMMLNALRKVKPTIPVSQVLLFCIAFGGIPLDAPAAIGGTQEAKDYLEIERVADPQISPDGQTILYTRRWIDRREDRWRSEIWVRKTNSDAHHFLLRGSNPRWSPSGNRVLFQAPDKYGRNQLFVARYPIAGEATQITRIASAPFSATWSLMESKSRCLHRPQKDQWSYLYPLPIQRVAGQKRHGSSAACTIVKTASASRSQVFLTFLLLTLMAVLPGS